MIRQYQTESWNCSWPFQDLPGVHPGQNYVENGSKHVKTLWGYEHPQLSAVLLQCRNVKTSDP